MPLPACSGGPALAPGTTSAARRAAAVAWAALPSTTSVKAPSERSPIRSLRMFSPRSESEPGTLKRFDSRPPRFAAPAAPSTNRTNHVPRITARWRTTMPVQRRIGRLSVSERGGEFSFEPLARARADQPEHRLAGAEEHEGGHREHAVARGGLLIVVDVEAHDAQVVALAGELGEDRIHDTAGRTPRGGEVDEHRLVGLQHLRGEGVVSDFLHAIDCGRGPSAIQVGSVISVRSVPYRARAAREGRCAAAARDRRGLRPSPPPTA